MEKLNSISELIKSLENDPDFTIEKEQLMNRSRDESGEIIEKNIQLFTRLRLTIFSALKKLVQWYGRY